MDSFNFLENAFEWFKDFKSGLVHRLGILNPDTSYGL